MDTTPFWQEAPSGRGYPELGEDIETEVLVIGGGLTGVSAAWQIARQGNSVVMIDREAIGGRDTARTTAHLTYMTDTRLSDLVATFSRRKARLAWEAGAAAMRWIKDRVEERSVDCGWREVPG
jgi:glycine/D-amino acid oxidase-like deaminating enzyme